MNFKVSIIGAGIGGLASAVRMASRGHEVTVFEQADRPGGKIGQLQWNGFRWDSGPSLFTLPELMAELFQLAGEKMVDSIKYRKLEIITKYFYEDGLVLNAFGDMEKFISEIVKKTGEQETRIRRFFKKAAIMYDLTRDVFIVGVFNSFRTFTSAKFLKALLHIYRLEVFSTMHGANRRRFKSKHLVQLLDRYATYNGSNPYEAPGTLNVISHLEHGLGAYFPEEGMQILTRELYNLAKRLGVRFEFNSRVERIIHHKKSVSGLIVNNQKRQTDLLISDIDIFYIYRDLLSDISFPEKYFRPERSTSAMIFYWAIDRSFPELEVHNLLFSANYKEEFDHLFKTKTIIDDPTSYIFISSKIVSNDAPKDRENWFVMINVPENTGQDWDEEIIRARKNIIKKVNRMLDIEIEKHIIHEFVRDPRNIENETFSYRGSLYGNSSNSSLAAFNRHPNHRRAFKGLYFVGGSVHPGGGIPLCLASAKIVDQQINNQ